VDDDNIICHEKINKWIKLKTCLRTWGVEWAKHKILGFKKGPWRRKVISRSSLSLSLSLCLSPHLSFPIAHLISLSPTESLTGSFLLSAPSSPFLSLSLSLCRNQCSLSIRGHRAAAAVTLFNYQEDPAAPERTRTHIHTHTHTKLYFA